MNLHLSCNKCVLSNIAEPAYAFNKCMSLYVIYQDSGNKLAQVFLEIL